MDAVGTDTADVDVVGADTADVDVVDADTVDAAVGEPARSSRHPASSAEPTRMASDALTSCNTMTNSDEIYVRTNGSV
jgi:hypothetical protein